MSQEQKSSGSGDVFSFKPGSVRQMLEQGKMKKVPSEFDPEPVSFEQAHSILVDDYIGPSEVEDALDIKIVREHITPIPFTVDELMRAKKNNFMLIYRPDITSGGSPITMEWLEDHWNNFQYDKKNGIRQILDHDRSFPDDKGEYYYEDNVPRAGWALVSRTTIPGSRGANYLEQTELITSHVKDVFYKDTTLPEMYKYAVKEFSRKKKRLDSYFAANFPGYLEKLTLELAHLDTTEYFRPTMVELMFDQIVNFQRSGTRLYANTCAMTSSTKESRHFLSLRFNFLGGMEIGFSLPVYGQSELGAVISMRKS